MPSHKVHCFVDRVLFGKSYWRLHRQIDMPFLFLGNKHRVLFHDPFTPVAIAQWLYPGDPRAKESALVHVQIDSLCSTNPIFKMQLEYFAEQDARKRRSSRKKKAKSRKRKVPADPLEEFTAFLEKMKEIRRLARIVFG
jgi:hypothetical protein